MPMFCHSCGSTLVDGGAFCSACGARVGPSGAPDPIPSTIHTEKGRHEVAIEAARKSGRPARFIVAGLAGVGVLALVVVIGRVADSGPNQPATIIKGPNYNEVAKPDSATPNATRTSVESGAAPEVASKPQPRVAMPADEIEFIRAVQQGQAAFRAAPNEMARGGTRSQRRLAICRILTGLSISGWVGQIEKLSSNSDGRGVLEISIADSIRVETWNNDLSDASDRTLIDPTSPLFAALSQMKQRDEVVFSGTFFPSGTDCVEEHSISLEGSMTDPEFMFRFQSVRVP